jgi:hypothetical protein
MAATTPRITGLARIEAKAVDIAVLINKIVLLINLIVPASAPKVVINLPTINIAGPIAATIKAAFTMNACVCGFNDLKPSTK